MAVTVGAAGCATRAPTHAADAAELARAQALVAVGCYACLREAVQIYERARPPRGAGPVTEGAQQAYQLLAFRERELGLPSSDAASKAAVLSTPASLPQDVLDRVLEILGEPQHLPDGEADKLAAVMAPLVQALSARAADNVAAAYALTAVTCRTFGRGPGSSAGEDPVPGRWRETSVAVQYADLACASAVATADVEALLDADPRFAEAHYLAGMSELQQGRLLSAYARLAKADEAFPASYAVMSALANVALAIGRIDEALGYYERALDVRDDPAARLGRAKALTYLERHHEAIAGLDALVEAGTWSPGEAHYWRAWNLYQLSQHGAARQDALRAIQSWPSPHVERLAGLTALALDQHDEARGHFEQALTRAPDDCESRLYLAQLDTHAQGWTAALDGFEAAAGCFARAAADRQRSQPEHESVAATAREIERLERWRASSIYSAAISAKVLGRRALALEHASRLLDDPALGSLARDFILDIDVPAAPARQAPAAPATAGLPPAS